jgi:hypothetical protein
MLSLEPCQLGVPSGLFKMISEPVVCLALIVHLSCTDTKTVSKQTDMRFHMMHVIYQFHRVRPKTDRNKLPLQPRHLAAPSGASKMISKPIVC